MSVIRPIEAQDLPEVGQFLHGNMKRRISSETWVASLKHEWSACQPNFGVQLRDEDRLVGVCCAIYSDQTINGRPERFCNPHSWCVLNDYRNSSISLILYLLKQPGYHFTMLTPNQKVTEIFLALRFRQLDDGLVVFANTPSFFSRHSGRFLECDPERIAAHLDGTSLRDFAQHRTIPWLKFAVFGTQGDVCLIIYKDDRWKRMSCARIVYISDSRAFDRHLHLLRHHLLTARGLLTSRVESRFLAGAPRFAYRTKRTQPKLVLSETLADSQIRDIYSELVALDV